jgi:leader peptidase (prepilin peptidase)/N-methyltransferase
LKGKILPESAIFFVQVVWFLTLGLCLGSFANVLIWRVPRKEGGWAWGRSHCPKCNATIRAYDNIPLISFLILRGKCRDCHAKIAWRYPLVELLMGVAFALLFWTTGWSWSLLEYGIFVFGLVTVSFIDLDHMILPDVFTLPGIAIGLLGAALNPERSFWSAFWGVIFGGGLLWLVAYIYFVARRREGMGGGDIKLLAWIGAVLGWSAIPFVILVSSVVGSVVGIVIALRSKSGMSSVIPFGPYLALSALLLVYGGRPLADWYVHLLIPALAP